MPELKRPQHFATISDGEIVTLGEAIPPTHELLDCQFELTKEEYWFLKSIDGEVEKAARIVKAIKAKIKANGS
jgi:hypothetical protein